MRYLVFAYNEPKGGLKDVVFIENNLKEVEEFVLENNRKYKFLQIFDTIQGKELDLLEVVTAPEKLIPEKEFIINYALKYFKLDYDNFFVKRATAKTSLPRKFFTYLVHYDLKIMNLKEVRFLFGFNTDNSILNQKNTLLDSFEIYPSIKEQYLNFRQNLL